MKTTRNIIRYWALCLGATALTLGAAGCVVIPTPHRDTGYARTNLTERTPQQFTPSQNTREDVMLALGEPDVVSADEHKLAYRTEKTVAVWLMVVGGGYSADVLGGEINRDRFFVFEFDSKGCLQKTTRMGKLLGNMAFGPDNLLNRENRGETVVAQPLPDEGYTSDMPTGIASGDIQAEYPHTVWLQGVNGYKSGEALDTTGIRGQLLITDTGLKFIATSQFANADPAFQLPLAAVARVSVDKRFLIRRLVIETKTGEFHSFEIFKSRSFLALDKPAMQTACDSIQSKIKQTLLQE